MWTPTSTRLVCLPLQVDSWRGRSTEALASRRPIRRTAPWGPRNNATTIWNVPVRTTLFGISNGSIFVGYNPNLQGTNGTSFNTGSDAILDEADLGTGAAGFLANNINIAMVFASVVPDATKPWLTELRASSGR